MTSIALILYKRHDVRSRRDDRRVRTEILAALVALTTALIVLVVARWLRTWRGSWRAQRRAARAGRGELRAERLLEAAGFRVVERQARVTWAPLIDGTPFHL